MSCACLKNQNKDGYTVSPYDYCPFCAEKHLSIAYGEFLQGKNRQLMLGELKCAQMHLVNKGEIISKIESLLDSRLKDASKEELEELISLNDLIIQEELDNNQVNNQVSKKFNESHSVPVGQDIKKSELAFCVAWRLAEECGYISINRNLIIEKLTMAQIYCYQIDYELAKKIRDVRHLIQYRKETEIGESWVQIAALYEVANAKSL